MEDMLNRINIRYNDAMVSMVCGICGTITRPEKPVDLFITKEVRGEKEEWAVCPECGKKYAYLLHRLLDDFYSKQMDDIDIVTRDRFCKNLGLHERYLDYIASKSVSY